MTGRARGPDGRRSSGPTGRGSRVDGRRSRDDGRRSRPDDRGVSVTVNYALNLVVATLLIAGVLTATGGMVEDRRESAARTELSVLGERIASDLMAADRLAVVATDGAANDAAVSVTVALPERVAGTRYAVAITTSPPRIELRSDDPEVTVRVGFRHETPVAEATLRSGDLRIELNTDPDPDRLEVTEA